MVATAWDVKPSWIKSYIMTKEKSNPRRAFLKKYIDCFDGSGGIAFVRYGGNSL